MAIANEELISRHGDRNAKAGGPIGNDCGLGKLRPGPLVDSNFVQAVDRDRDAVTPDTEPRAEALAHQAGDSALLHEGGAVELEDADFAAQADTRRARKVDIVADGHNFTEIVVRGT